MTEKNSDDSGIDEFCRELYAEHDRVDEANRKENARTNIGLFVLLSCMILAFPLVFNASKSKHSHYLIDKYGTQSTSSLYSIYEKNVIALESCGVIYSKRPVRRGLRENENFHQQFIDIMRETNSILVSECGYSVVSNLEIT